MYLFSTQCMDMFRFKELTVPRCNQSRICRPQWWLGACCETAWRLPSDDATSDNVSSIAVTESFFTEPAVQTSSVSECNVIITTANQIHDCMAKNVFFLDADSQLPVSRSLKSVRRIVMRLRLLFVTFVNSPVPRTSLQVRHESVHLITTTIVESYVQVCVEGTSTTQWNKIYLLRCGSQVRFHNPSISLHVCSAIAVPWTACSSKDLENNKLWKEKKEWRHPFE